jgi:hypothetical protein
MRSPFNFPKPKHMQICRTTTRLNEIDSTNSDRLGKTDRQNLRLLRRTDKTVPGTRPTNISEIVDPDNLKRSNNLRLNPKRSNLHHIQRQRLPLINPLNNYHVLNKLC